MHAEATTIAKGLQNCAVAWLEAGAEFAGVPIIGRRRSTIVNDIEAAVAELGACVYVLPGLPLRFLATSQPYADSYQLRVRCIENPAINTTHPDVFELVEFVVRRMYGVQWAALEGMNPLYPLESGPVVEQPDDERLIYDVLFTTSLGYAPRIES